MAPRVPLLGRGRIAAGAGVSAVPGWALHGNSLSMVPVLLGVILCLKCSSLSRGVAARCAFSPSLLGRNVWFFWLSPELSHCHFSVPIGCVRCWAASAESEGQAGGGQASPVGYVGQCGAVLCTPGALTDWFHSPFAGIDEMLTLPCPLPCPRRPGGTPTSLLPSGVGLGETLHAARGTWQRFNP